MLGKMLIHGLVAAVIVGGTAAIYSQIPDNGTPSPQTAQSDAAGQSNLAATLLARNDDVRSVGAEARGDGPGRSFRSDRTRDRHDRKRDHDDDDD
ncbi:hypothetical protein [Magnetospirillum gryphiswaldense]|uniref:hypothetical protein n=1 Tax=Magnetospirillum gryphiswaldense TaxID=55518 RepID=UPI000D03D886|nr:hypothetical protein [Magnetospirillum gryphiswaldense]AVM72934.1 hypothetical protein MSR1_04220 [Magnetospirillum gryphiswaldense MSR-1]AVM76837.1 hypothetical protein MSR1L_04220 [Magnetospirillum gryphiswaldense]